MQPSFVSKHNFIASSGRSLCVVLRMLNMRYDRTIIAYHGCDEDVANRLLHGSLFKKSRNLYDWLGTGVYFWEYGADRALKFARDQVTRGKVRTPSVVGAILQLGDCFDLMDTRFTELIAATYEPYLALLDKQGAKPPENKGDTPDKLLRYRDCAVLNFLLNRLETKRGKIFDTVRGCFTEGGPVFEGSFIHRQSHVQVAVRNLDCILGTFRPYLG